MVSNGELPAQFNIRPANDCDLPTVLRVVNQAFQVERFFLTHDRTNLENLKGLLTKGRFFLAEDRQGSLAGVVYVELCGERAHFGMLAVDSSRQGKGIGKLLVTAAEEYARTNGCKAMDITVVNLRTELPPYYRKLGYVECGTAPLHEGMRVSQPAHLIKMSKPL